MTKRDEEVCEGRAGGEGRHASSFHKSLRKRTTLGQSSQGLLTKLISRVTVLKQLVK